MKKSIDSLIVGLTVSVASLCAHDTRPNIIFMMSDDHAYQAISAYSDHLIDTPNIDRLAKEGMLFDRAFVTNSICSPSRAVTLTGKLSHINGVKDNRDVFDGSQQTLPKLLQAAGYQTAIFGKWHLKSKPTGFDYWRVLPDQGEYFHPEFVTSYGNIKVEGYVQEVITNMAVDYLENIRNEDKPFFMMYQHKAPHRYWMPPLRLAKEFVENTYPEPATLFDDYAGRPAAEAAEMRISTHMALSSDNKLRPDILEKHGYEEWLIWYQSEFIRMWERYTPEEQAEWERIYGPINAAFDEAAPQGDELTRWKYQRYMQDYLATIRSVDNEVGRLLDYLDAAGLAENTIVVYTSDQGFYLGEHGWFDKRFMYEESFRTPLLVRWPAHIDAGTVNSQLVQNLDFAPTLLDAAGVDIPQDMQGMSFKPLLEQSSAEWRDAIYYHYFEYPSIHMVKRHYGVRTDRYKLIHFYDDIDQWELYDLETDPQELNNLYGQPAMAKIQAQLEQRLADLRKQYGDTDELAEFYIQDWAEYMKTTQGTHTKQE